MRIVYIAVLLLFSLVTADAQVGIKGGLVKSTLNSGFDDAVDNGTPVIPTRKANSGFTIGVVYNHCLGCDFGFQPELSYTQKGQSYSTSDNRDVDIKLAYIDMPINIRWRFFKPFYVYAGPMISYAINKSYKYSKGGTQYSDSVLDKSYKSFDWGVNTGLGIQYDRFFIDARVTRGFLTQDAQVEFNESTLPKYGFRNFTMQFTGGIYF